MVALPVLALLLAAPVPLKCPTPPTAMPGYELRQAVVVIDGHVLPGDVADTGLDVDDVASAHILCWDPATDAFAQNGIPVIRIDTWSLVRATRAPLLQLVRAQEEFRARHGRYASDLAALAPLGLDPETPLELHASESAWSASTPAGEVAYRCVATEASATTLTEEGEPLLDCGPVDTLALRSLRKLYDSGRGARQP